MPVVQSEEDHGDVGVELPEVVEIADEGVHGDVEVDDSGGVTIHENFVKDEEVQVAKASNDEEDLPIPAKNEDDVILIDGLSRIAQELQAATHQMEAAISMVGGIADSFTSIRIIRNQAKEDMAIGVVKHELIHNIMQLSDVLNGSMLSIGDKISRRAITARVVPREELMQKVKELRAKTATTVPAVLPRSSEPTLWGAGIMCFWFLLPADGDPAEAVKHIDPLVLSTAVRGRYTEGPPKGSIKVGETEQQAFRRELWEETNVNPGQIELSQHFRRVLQGCAYYASVYVPSDTIVPVASSWTIEDDQDIYQASWRYLSDIQQSKIFGQYKLRVAVEAWYAICADPNLLKLRVDTVSARAQPREAAERTERTHPVEELISREEARATKPCRDYIKGHCRWGDRCRYSHDDEAVQRAKNKKCYEFMEKGKCKYGRKCKFLHGSPEPEARLQSRARSRSPRKPRSERSRARSRSPRKVPGRSEGRSRSPVTRPVRRGSVASSGSNREERASAEGSQKPGSVIDEYLSEKAKRESPDPSDKAQSGEEGPDLGARARGFIKESTPQDDDEPDDTEADQSIIKVSSAEDETLWLMEDQKSGIRKRQDMFIGHKDDVTQWMTAVHLRKELLCKPYNDERTCDGNHMDKQGKHVKRVHRCDALIPEMKWSARALVPGKMRHQNGQELSKPQPGQVVEIGRITSRICGEKHQRLSDHMGNLPCMGKDAQNRILVILPQVQ